MERLKQRESRDRQIREDLRCKEITIVLLMTDEILLGPTYTDYLYIQNVPSPK